MERVGNVVYLGKQYRWNTKFGEMEIDRRFAFLKITEEKERPKIEWKGDRGLLLYLDPGECERLMDYKSLCFFSPLETMKFEYRRHAYPWYRLDYPFHFKHAIARNIRKVRSLICSRIWWKLIELNIAEVPRGEYCSVIPHIVKPILRKAAKLGRKPYH
jgi:hypothetical protein